jgi:hypothetical protein
VLVDSKGMTLYWFAIDTSTASKCTGSCLTYWPPVKGPVTAGSGVTGTLGTITGSDGTKQATYLGHPLYTYVGDKRPRAEQGQRAQPLRRPVVGDDGLRLDATSERGRRRYLLAQVHRHLRRRRRLRLLISRSPSGRAVSKAGAAPCRARRGHFFSAERAWFPAPPPAPRNSLPAAYVTAGPPAACLECAYHRHKTAPGSGNGGP